MSAALYHYQAQASMAALKGQPGTTVHYFDLLGATIPVEVAWSEDHIGEFPVLCNAYVNGHWVDVQDAFGDRLYDQWIADAKAMR